jgi:hypothetical protein
MHSDLSDNQKRFICRMLFLVFCAIPTCVTIYVATHKRTPDQWAQILQAELGVQTSIGAVETPLPDVLVLRDVKLYDNDGVPFFESLGARIELGNVNQIVFPNREQITLEGLAHFAEEAAERMVKPQANAKPWTVSFQRVLLQGERETERFEGPIFAEWFSDKQGGVVRIEYPLRENEELQQYEDFVELKIARNETRGLRVKFDSPDGFMPCWVAKPWFPELEQKLGENALFSGFAKVDCIHSTTDCQLTGTFRNIQLPHYLIDANSRDAEAIHVNRLQVVNNDWIGGTAKLQVADGVLPMPRTDSGQISQFDQGIRAASYYEDIETTYNR